MSDRQIAQDAPGDAACGIVVPCTTEAAAAHLRAVYGPDVDVAAVTAELVVVASLYRERNGLELDAPVEVWPNGMSGASHSWFVHRPGTFIRLEGGTLDIEHWRRTSGWRSIPRRLRRIPTWFRYGLGGRLW